MEVETVAFYGAGMLGSGFVQALCKRGVRVRVWNRTFEKAKALEKFGAVAVESPADAALDAARVHLCLRDDASVDQTLDAALAAIARGTPVIDHSTVLPANVVPRTQRLRERGVPFLHAPVFMGPPNAASATGLMLVSGNSGVYESVRAELAPMTSTVWYVGERPDIAAVYKLMGNAMILSIIGGINEMFTIAQAGGIERADAYRLFDYYSPSAQITGRGKRMAAQDYEPTWTLESARKDANLMLATAGDRALPVIAAIEGMLKAAIERGLGTKDLAAISLR